MLLFSLFTLLPLGLCSHIPQQGPLFSNFPEHANRIPTVHESAVLARRMLQLTKIGTLSTVFPHNLAISNDQQILSADGTLEVLSDAPKEVAGLPIGMMEYFSSCTPTPYTSDPTILAVSISTSMRNVAVGSNITLSLRWHPPSSNPLKPTPPSLMPVAVPRYSLIGYLEEIPYYQYPQTAACYVRAHPDAASWLPGNRIHETKFVRLAVREIYWVGGFGDRAYIGWIPKKEWESVTDAEINEALLPGEEASSAFRGIARCGGTYTTFSKVARAWQVYGLKAVRAFELLVLIITTSFFLSWAVAIVISYSIPLAQKVISFGREDFAVQQMDATRAEQSFGEKRGPIRLD
jgi:Pyridoxamine 5'-phosphate oxidase